MTTVKRSQSLLVGALAMALLLSPSPEAVAQDNTGAETAALGALDHSLETARKTKNYELMGLRFKAELDEAMLGKPLPVREIGYDRLVAHEEGAAAKSVFAGPEQLAYPVEVGGEIRSTIDFVRVDNEWQMTGYGGAERADAIRSAKVGFEGRAAGEFSLVTVPAFHLTFLASEQDGKTLLSPLGGASIPELELEGPIEESELIARLSRYAKDFDAEYGEAIRQRRLVN